MRTQPCQPKLSIEEAMAPATAAAVLATRAVQDARTLLDLDKLRFDISEKSYANALLMAESTRKAAEHTSTRTLGRSQRREPRDRRRSTIKTARRANGPWPEGANQPVQVTVGDVHAGSSLEQVLEAVKAQIISAWGAAMEGHPVNGMLGGSYNMG